MALIKKIVADFKTSLSVKISVAGTTGSIQNNLDDDGVALPTGSYFFTIDADSAQKEHIIATLTGKNLTDIQSINRQGVITSGVVREHRIGASVSITDFAHIMIHNNILNGDSALENKLKYATDLTFTDNKELVAKKYVDDVVIAGGVDASSTLKGISKLSSDPSVSTNPIALNSEEVSATAGNNKVVRANSSGKIATDYISDSMSSGLEVGTANGTQVKIKSGGGIIRDTDGLSIDSSNVNVKNAIQLTTEINMLTNKAVIIGDGTPSANGSITSGSDDNSNYESLSTTFKVSTSFVMPSAVYNISLTGGSYKFFMYSGSGTAIFHLYAADSNGIPTGSSLANSGSISIPGSAPTNFSIAYSGLLAAGNYVIVADITLVSGTVRLYNVTSGSNPNCKSYNWNGSTWVSRSLNPVVFNYTATKTKSGHIDYSNTTNNDSFANNFIGFTIESKNAEELIKVQTDGVVSGFTGLTIGSTYYLSNTSGDISTSAGSQSRKIGKAISTTQLLLIKDNI